MDSLLGYSSSDSENVEEVEKVSEVTKNYGEKLVNQERLIVKKQEWKYNTKPTKPYISTRKRKSCSNEINQNQNTKLKIHVGVENLSSQQVLEVPEELTHNPTPNRIPSRTIIEFNDHKKGVNVLRWNECFGHLLASASMDGSVKIFDVFREKSEICTIDHLGGVKDCQWNHDGRQLISGGFDKKVTLSDLSTGSVIHTYDHPQYVTAMKFHPTEPSVFLSGMHKGGLLAWDIRSNQIIKSYPRFFGQVQDFQFLPDSKYFMTCSDFVLRNSADKSIVVWDFDSGTVHSNQIYQEAFSCTCLRTHPNQRSFVAQTNGNYVAIFNLEKPWKMNQHKRFEGHQVAGFRIQCSISHNGTYVASGSADGSLYFYEWSSSKLLKIIRNAHYDASMDVVWHPTQGNIVASCGWDGKIKIWN
ncbi:hypothetical protein K7432_002642 [Basidiobolus ranarum]|uniref:Translation initiation factor beta propellor-like domain-containing protein n=1 Tax=Basidiobolus ranarum TaxID=34480 RepID=A0ABR2W7F7_9FUNG